ncbi:hypothetical protein EDF24_1968 [Curtobacterium sp. PhB130]|uniref:hypothetical protein n=1 Tax=Curtobacterium sp. PhB130 TaxID=2485178 RepID=UPI000F4CD923|nr:hypothetical protein [Curtobacterium sp. PhB130]ROS76379.1 hypothetical protein EDF24_1968 [Curtobacterium sp. PhB130]
MATEARTLSMSTRAALWIRRPGAWVEIASWAALVAFVLFTIGPALLGHGTFLNTGLLNRFTPWADTFQSTTQSSNVFDSDTIDSAAPQVSLLVRLAQEGVFGAWNPYVAGGTELGGLPDSGAWSPLSLPWWVLPFSYAPGAVKLLEIVVVTVGMALLLRRWGVPRAGWPIAAIVYSASGFMVAWTNWPQTRVAAFIPLLFWAIDRAATERKLRDVVAVGVALACMLLGGFPAIVGYALFTGGIYFVARSIVALRSVRGVLVSAAIAVGGIVFGLFLSAWQLLPFAVNAANVIDFGARAQSGGGGTLGYLSLVSSWVADIANDESRGDAWSGRNPVETASFVGIAVVVLIAAALLVRPRVQRAAGIVWILLGLLALSVVLVYVGGPVLAAIRELPVFDSNPIGRMRCIVGFLAAALAGIGFGRLVEPEHLLDELRRLRSSRPLAWIGRGLVVLIVLAAAAGVAYQTRMALYSVPVPHLHELKVDVVRTAVIGALTALAIALVWFFRSRVLAAVAGVGVIAMVVVPAISSVQAWWPIAPVSTFYPSTPALKYLENHLTDQERFATAGQAGLPGSASYFQIRSLTGHTFQTQEWKQLMTAIDPDVYVTPTYSSLRPTNLPSTISSPLLDRLAVRYVISDPSAPLVGQADPSTPSTAWADLTKANPSVDSPSNTGPINGIEFTGPPAPTNSADGMDLTVSIVADDTGKTLTSTETWVPGLGGGRAVALEGDDIPASTSWHAEITVTGQDKRVPIGTDADGKAAITVVRPEAGDDVTVAHTGDATIYELGGTDDRVRWASSQTVVQKAADRVDTLDDPATPADEVVLSKPTKHTAGGGDAELDVDSSDPNATTVDVDAEQGGWVVVEDSLQRPGWSATVDGKSTPLVAADHAGGAVWVPAGKHTVAVSYTVPGLSAGLVATIGSVLVAIVVGVLVVVLGRRRRRAGPGAEPTGSTEILD